MPPEHAASPRPEPGPGAEESALPVRRSAAQTSGHAASSSSAQRLQCCARPFKTISLSCVGLQRENFSSRDARYPASARGRSHHQLCTFMGLESTQEKTNRIKPKGMRTSMRRLSAEVQMARGVGMGQTSRRVEQRAARRALVPCLSFPSTAPQTIWAFPKVGVPSWGLCYLFEVKIKGPLFSETPIF